MNAGCAGKTVRSLEKACHTTSVRLRGVFTTRRYTNTRLPLRLPLSKTNGHQRYDVYTLASARKMKAGQAPVAWGCDSARYDETRERAVGLRNAVHYLPCARNCITESCSDLTYWIYNCPKLRSKRIKQKKNKSKCHQMLSGVTIMQENLQAASEPSLGGAYSILHSPIQHSPIT